MEDRTPFRRMVNLILTTDHSPTEASGTLFSEKKLKSVMYSSIFFMLLENSV